MAPPGRGAGNRGIPVNRGEVSKRGSGSIANCRGGGTGNRGGGNMANRGGGTTSNHGAGNTGNRGAGNKVRESDDELMDQKAVFLASFASTLDRVPPDYRGYQNEEEFRSIAQQWQQQMQGMEFAPISDSDPPFVKAAVVWYRLKAAIIKMPNPFAQAMLTKAASSATKVEERFELYISILGEGNWVGAVLELLMSIRGYTENEDEVAERQEKLYDHWCGDYCGTSLQALEASIQDYQTNWRSDYTTNYPKSINIVQSSGMGKSRLADEMGKKNFQFAFIFRNSGDTGYPPCDPEITNYLRQGSSHPSILVAALYAAVGSIGISDHP